MTEAVALKPDLGRFGVWLPTRSITPELAAEDRIARLRRGLDRRITGRGTGLGRPRPGADHLVAAGHRDRQYLVGAGTGGRRVLSPHRKRLSGKVSARHRGRPLASTPRSTASPTTRWSVTSTQLDAAVVPTSRRVLAALGPRVLRLRGATQRRRPPVSDHAGTHGQGARTGRQVGVPGAGAQGGAHHRRRAKPARSAARPSTSIWA